MDVGKYFATLAHVFKHGTHRRGQISAGLTAAGRAYPQIELVWTLQAQGRTL